MKASVNLYSQQSNEIKKFLELFYGQKNIFDDTLQWSNVYENPIEMVDIIGGFIDNNYKFNINMWISIDEGFFINITNYNADTLIKYLFERFPY